jgi:hypothetical protein
MTKKQAKYAVFMALFAFFLITDKMFDLWKGWYVLDSIGLAFYLYRFIDVSNADTNDNN